MATFRVQPSHPQASEAGLGLDRPPLPPPDALPSLYGLALAAALAVMAAAVMTVLL